MKIPHSIMGLCCVVLLSACGSGGGDGAPAAPAPQSFRLQGAFSDLFRDGMTKGFTVSGSCTGTATVKQAPSVAATFENVAGFSAVNTQTLTTNCPVPSGVRTIYYDKNHAPLGYENGTGLGSSYGVFRTPQEVVTAAAMPETGKVGDLGNLGTLTNYTDRTKLVKTGTTKSSFVIGSDTPTTAIVSVIGQNFDTVGVLQSTETDRYRIGATGPAVLISIDSQEAIGAKTHLRLEE